MNSHRAATAAIMTGRAGCPGPQIARRRGVSTDAVKFHVANALDKLGLDSRASLRAWRGVPADSALAAQHTVSQHTVSRKDHGMPDDGLRLGPIGQVGRHVSDLSRAVRWYGTVLGLPHLYTFGDLAFFDCGGVRLFLFAHGNGAASEPSVLYFQVPDINAAYDSLTARGVAFEGAPHMIHRHDSGLEEWMAFFPDPDGHLLAIMSQVQRTAATASGVGSAAPARTS